MDKRLKILFVCTINRMRSATANEIFVNDVRFDVKSAGTDSSAKIVLSSELLEWADAIVVMEKYHRNFIRNKFNAFYQSKRIVCLYIPDEYDFMQEELIIILKQRMDDVYTKGFLG